MNNQYFTKSSSSLPPSCPNVSLFRFLGAAGVRLSGRSVFELGFGGNHGADLLTMHARGARKCIGLDINKSYVDSFNKSHANDQDQNFSSSVRAICCDIASFDYAQVGRVDIAFGRDIIYYLNDKEISRVFSSIFSALLPDGVFCVQFIERDFLLRSPVIDFTPDVLMDADVVPLHNASNPIRYLTPSM